MANSIMLDKAKTFAVEIVHLCRSIKATHKESVLTNQLLRSGTSIGANIREAKYAHSRPAFVSKLQIALKECYETEYWLELMEKAALLPPETTNVVLHDCGQIRAFLSPPSKPRRRIHNGMFT